MPDLPPAGWDYHFTVSHPTACGKRPDWKQEGDGSFF
jgi:hypothetical protein